jgi:hypothetical protein
MLLSGRVGKIHKKSPSIIKAVKLLEESTEFHNYWFSVSPSYGILNTR